jgi:hypothetical protein
MDLHHFSIVSGTPGFASRTELRFNRARMKFTVQSERKSTVCRLAPNELLMPIEAAASSPS